MFRGIKLYFTDRDYYNQRKRYLMLQKAARKQLKKLAKEFCPWSGYYMHEMVRAMLEFYAITYRNGDCCWGEETRVQKIANQVEKALSYASFLDAIEEMESEELLNLAQKEQGFEKWLLKWKNKTGCDFDGKPALLSGLAHEYFEEKYTKALYDYIGKHIWEWCD